MVASRRGRSWCSPEPSPEDPLGKRERAKNRCPDCLMSAPLCICSAIPRLTIRTSVIVLMHHREVKMPTNTGRLAHQCLVGSRLVLRGLKDEPAELGSEGAFAGTPLLLHPTEDAIPLDASFQARVPPPYTLIVPDGSWRQASKMGSREESLRAILRVKLPTSEPSRYRLRKETKPGGLATIEAIARALGFLESPEVEEALEKIFALMVERTLLSRGVKLG
ncbi:MAG: tRNA-uridine aminocarboxypropyltransferase [Byssovorax sp.]